LYRPSKDGIGVVPVQGGLFRIPLVSGAPVWLASGTNAEIDAFHETPDHAHIIYTSVDHTTNTGNVYRVSINGRASNTTYELFRTVPAGEFCGYQHYAGASDL
jgi:hypothetical protein